MRNNTPATPSNSPTEMQNLTPNQSHSVSSLNPLNNISSTNSNYTILFAPSNNHQPSPLTPLNHQLSANITIKYQNLI